MQFGLIISSDDPTELSPTQRFQTHMERVRLARDNGFRSIVAAHRYSFGAASGPQSVGISRFQPIPLLARVAAEVPEMRLITGIFLYTLHNPVDIAEQVATLDAICEGRLVFGIGVGWVEAEFQAFGVPRSERANRFSESLQLLKKLWTEDVVNFEGKHFKVNGVRLGARPVQKPHPPIWIGAEHPRAVVRAAELGDTWFISPYVTLPELEEHLALYRQALARVGKPFPLEFPIARTIFVAKDRETALKRYKEPLEAIWRKRAAWGWFDNVKSIKPTFEFEDIIRDRYIFGSPDDAVEQIARFEERLGVTTMVFNPRTTSGQVTDFAWEREAIELLGAKVLPRFRD